MRIQHISIVLISIWLGFNSALAQAPLTRFSPPEVIFTDPSRVAQGQGDHSILNRILELIESVPAGEEITVCVFKFEKGKLANALIEAQKRGVKVRVIINKGETSTDVNQQTNKIFKSELDDFHYVANNIAKKSIIHNKFLLFSRIESFNGSYPNVVLQTSSNFQDKGTGKLQDAIIISEPGLYYAYLDFWYEIKVLGNAGQLDEYDYLKFDRGGQYAAYFFPKRKDGEESGKDVILKILDNVNNPANTSLRFAHGKWTEGREKIIKELEKLISDGATVEIVTNKDVDKDIKSGLEDLDADITFLGKDLNLHTKFFLVDDGSNRTVYTGSHNLSERSLRQNFEVLLELRDHEIYEEYSRFFEEIKGLD